jgi:threonyl-tRNA synthetase
MKAIQCRINPTTARAEFGLLEPQQLCRAGRNMEAGNVSVRPHGKGNIGAKPKAEVVADILMAIKERRA